MKPNSLLKVIVLFLLFNSNAVKAQQVCLVTADFQTAEHYMVVWEKPLITTGLDSVNIYRKTGMEWVFTKIGSQHMNELSFFLDSTSNTMDTTKYAITFVDNFGNESALSLWHQAVVLDYTDGMVFWTKYKKEAQPDESYIYGYECMLDQTGFGAYSSMGYFMNYQTNWSDQQAMANPISTYYIDTHLPSCNMTKANINTSRSNIKKQASNAEAGVENLSSLNISLSPNPVEGFLNITVKENSIGDTYSLIDAAGKQLASGTINAKNFILDASQFPSGTYYFSISNADNGITKMFVKN